MLVWYRYGEKIPQCSESENGMGLHGITMGKRTECAKRQDETKTTLKEEKMRQKDEKRPSEQLLPRYVQDVLSRHDISLPSPFGEGPGVRLLALQAPRYPDIDMPCTKPALPTASPTLLILFPLPLSPTLLPLLPPLLPFLSLLLLLPLPTTACHPMIRPGPYSHIPSPGGTWGGFSATSQAASGSTSLSWHAALNGPSM